MVLGKRERVWEKGRGWQKVVGREGRRKDTIMGTGEEYGYGEKEEGEMALWEMGKREG